MDYPAQPLTSLDARCETAQRILLWSGAAAATPADQTLPKVDERDHRYRWMASNRSPASQLALKGSTLT
jgi:hypothetical protein